MEMAVFALGGNNLDYLGRKKGFKFGSGRGQWCQVSEADWDLLGWLKN